MFINTLNIVVFAVAVVLWIAAFVLQGKAEKIYKGCTNAFTGYRWTHHYVCGYEAHCASTSRGNVYKTRGSRDENLACSDCKRRSSIGNAAQTVAFLYYVVALLVLMHNDAWLLVLVLAAPALVLAGVATIVGTVRKTREMAILWKQPRAAS